MECEAGLLAPNPTSFPVPSRVRSAGPAEGLFGPESWLLPVIFHFTSTWKFDQNVVFSPKEMCTPATCFLHFAYRLCRKDEAPEACAQGAEWTTCSWGRLCVPVCPGPAGSSRGRGSGVTGLL